MADDDWHLPATTSTLASYRRKLDSDRRHDDLLRQQRKQHEEQLSAINRKSDREQALEGREQSLVRAGQALAERDRGLHDEYSKRWAALESEFGDRVQTAISSRMSEVDRHRQAAGTVLDALWQSVKRGHEINRRNRDRLMQAESNVREGIDRLRRMQGLPPIEADDRPDPATDRESHRDDVESDVTAAMETHRESVQ